MPEPTAMLLQQAAGHLKDGQLAAAEQILIPMLAAAPHPEALHLLGRVRYRQKRNAEAAQLFTQALASDPNQASAQVNLGLALAAQALWPQAAVAFRAALALRPDFVQAQYELAGALHKMRQWREAEVLLRALLRQFPGHVPARLALATVLADSGQMDDAEAVLQDGLSQSSDPIQKAALHAALARAQRLRSRNAMALENIEKAQALDPALSELDLQRAELLQNLKRYEESLSLYRSLLARYPLDVHFHNDYNDLLYRLGREDEYLKSFDRAPATPALQLAKAKFLMYGRRAEEAHAIYGNLLARDPGDKQAGIGFAMALVRTGRHAESVAAFEKLTLRHTDDADLYFLAAMAALRHGDPQRAVALSEKGLAVAPGSQGCLAAMGTALRLMGDARDEYLSGYDTLIRVFDLEPPEGFSNMEAFNQELCALLEELHPPTREYISQSLLGGSQTPEYLFDAGHDLIRRLQQRITQAVSRYIAELTPDEVHPFVARRRKGFAYAGSWSSRLRDQGFHVNHIHTAGWISSCYYAGVPDVVADKEARQGWIKFGEPDLDIALAQPIRRAIQPAPGRLVLFPSYLWHGTIPFHAPTPRLTVAFDVIPD